MRKFCSDFLLLPSVKWSLVALFFMGFSITQLFAQELPFLQLSKDKSYIETKDGEPFFWLGDTAWELVHRLNREEVIEYFRNRKEKGFTVVQTVILTEMDGLHTANVYGETPLINDDPTQWNDAYFEHLDFVLSEAEKQQLYVGLLPTWGDKFNKKWGVGPEIFSPENAEKYGRLLGNRYKDCPNIIWILGGDRIPENALHHQIVRGLARGLQKEDKNHLITYHPSASKMASEFFDESWLDLDMFQSGHSSVTKEYQYPGKSLDKMYKRPVINGEARYEDIPDRFWDNRDYGRLDATDVRISAYWSLLAGAAGYTYGSNDIWQMYSDGTDPVLNAKLGWKKALDLPGAYQMKHLKQLFISLDWQELEPAQELITGSNPENSGYIVAAKTQWAALFYTPEGRSVSINLKNFEVKKLQAYWFNPREGTYQKLEKFGNAKLSVFDPPSLGKGLDWLLFVLPKNRHINTQID